MGIKKVRDLLNKLFPGNKNEGLAADEAETSATDAPESAQEERMEEAREKVGGDPAGEVLVTLNDPEATIPTGFPVNDAEQESEEEIDIGKTIPLRPVTDAMISAGIRAMQAGQRDSDLPVVRAVQRCNIGSVRARNEDSSYMFTTETGGQEPMMPFGLFIVADGMGGHYAGHEASKNVSRLVARQIVENIYLPMLYPGAATPQIPIQEVILGAVQAANAAIHSPDPEKDSGTTLTTALVFGRRLHIAHVGDSRAYMLAEGELKLITTDHSYVRRLQEAGQLTEEEAASHPHRNMLYRAVGQGGELEIDIFTQPLPKSGKLVLCSDGLWGLVPEPMMQEVLESDMSLQEMADELVNLAVQAGGYDNITAILVDFAL